MCCFKKGITYSDSSDDSDSDIEMTDSDSESESESEEEDEDDDEEEEDEPVSSEPGPSRAFNEQEENKGEKNKKLKNEDTDNENEEDQKEEEEEDELVKAIRSAKERSRNYPLEIKTEDLIVDISFHPGSNILAAGSIEGDVFLYKYENNYNELVSKLELHVKSCRDLEFSEDGSILFSAGKDKCVMLTDTATGKLKKFYENAHEQPLYKLYVFNENVFTTGDDEGTVKVWDIRQNDPVMSFKHIEEFITDMITTDAKKFLVCSSGDGTVTAFNIPAKKMFVQSEGYEAGLNCMQLLKYERKLLVCSSKGKMYLFNWGEFGYHNDEYCGPKHCINSALSITENIVVAGYEDGNIRAFNLFPHQHLGVVGQHQSSVEALDISHDGNYIASSSLDENIKFWNIKYFEDVCVLKKKINKKKSFEVNLPSSKVKNASDFFADLI